MAHRRRSGWRSPGKRCAREADQSQSPPPGIAATLAGTAWHLAALVAVGCNNMLVCVDGTGPSDTEEYASVFASSFVNRVKREYQSIHTDPPPIHHRGPGDTLTFLDGFGGTFGGVHHVEPRFVFEEMMTTLSHVDADWARSSPGAAAAVPWSAAVSEVDLAYEDLAGRRRVFMAGHSRGAAIIIHVARLLQRRHIDVEAMFLFDAVARNHTLDAGEIPSNVRHCYHAIRHPDGRSRGSFGNCGTFAAAGVDFRSEFFFTTHGGMGGTPWGRRAGSMTSTGTFISEGDPMGSTVITPEAEARGMLALEVWMWRHLRRHGVVPEASSS
jgi:hypothetical protein